MPTLKINGVALTVTDEVFYKKGLLEAYLTGDIKEAERLYAEISEGFTEEESAESAKLLE